MRDATVQRAVQVCKALGDPTRVRIVNLLSALGELCVGDVEVALEIRQSNASRHMTVLRNAGLVRDRRDGSWVYYRIDPDLDPFSEGVVASLMSVLREQEAIVAEVERARDVRRSPIPDA